MWHAKFFRPSQCDYLAHMISPFFKFHFWTRIQILSNPNYCLHIKILYSRSIRILISNSTVEVILYFLVNLSLLTVFLLIFIFSFNDAAWNQNCCTAAMKNLYNTKRMRLVMKSNYLIGATWKLQVKIGKVYSLMNLAT